MLDGKVAIVTGGGRGLGRAHCLALAQAGATVVVNDLGAGLHGEETTESAADQVVAEIVCRRGPGDRRSRIGRRLVSDGGPGRKDGGRVRKLDIIVNNAGIIRDRMLFSMSAQDFDAVINVHLQGTFALTTLKHGHPVLSEADREWLLDRHGRIVEAIIAGDVGLAQHRLRRYFERLASAGAIRDETFSEQAPVVVGE